MPRTKVLIALFALSVFAGGVSLLNADDKKPASTEEFIAHAMDCNLFERDLANTARSKAENADVKKYAEQLYDDHDRMSKELLDFAKEKKLAVASGTSRDQKAKVADLLKLRGKDFDRRFVDIMVEEHEKAIDMMQHCAKESKDEKVRSISEKALPTLKKHLEEARALKKKLAS
jgi:putative membrane protein